MKLLVCGGRDYSDRERVFRTLDMACRESPELDGLVHGGATGADSLAAQWAKARSFPVKCYPADWNAHGKRAGPVRNAQMLREESIGLVVAFPGGAGTADMVRRSLADRIRTVEVQKNTMLHTTLFP